jgi:uncharacterized protein YhfF
MAFPVIDDMRVIEFGTPGALRAKLVNLVVAGPKQATAGLLAEYVEDQEPFEHVGERLVVVDNAGARVAVIEVTRVDVVRFADVPDDFALAEGEGDLSGDDFRASHSRYWVRLGMPVNEDTEVVLVRFRLIST